jgi:hypothetical protein
MNSCMKALYIKDCYTGHAFYSTIMITITQQKLCVKCLLLYRDYIELYSDVVGLCFFTSDFHIDIMWLLQ